MTPYCDRIAMVVVLVCPLSRLSDIYTVYLPHDALIFQFLRRRVIYTTAALMRAQDFFQFKTVGGAETFESWPSEKGVKSK